MRKLVAETAWRVEGGRVPESIDRRVVALLAGLDTHGSLTGAARDLRMPYRTAWALLDATERALGVELALSTRGRGARLTPVARRWLEAHAAATGLLAEVAPVSTHAEGNVTPRLLRVAASHDVALAQLRDRWQVAHRIAVAFHGSSESLDAYREGNSDLAGFHYAFEPRAGDDPLLARLQPSRDAVLRFITRAQGLILARGNPRQVRALDDLAGKRLTIVNRQPGSGTRLLLDRLLAEAGIAPGSLAGYSNEEFTHAAVAATVAAGRADAGFGVEAAAAQLGLAFVPLVRERYVFACRRRAVDGAAITAFRALLASDATRAVVKPLRGYRLDAPGTLAERF
jgi:putative molybdopterin biosynthesis protein